ncbi:hypothetical protein G9A89_000037 [Geosiphon pyriformis]|nr:hypothetical protein G9A89_000037 [Geosiphon pyriformis]
MAMEERTFATRDPSVWVKQERQKLQKCLQESIREYAGKCHPGVEWLNNFLEGIILKNTQNMGSSFLPINPQEVSITTSLKVQRTSLLSYPSYSISPKTDILPSEIKLEATSILAFNKVPKLSFNEIDRKSPEKNEFQTNIDEQVEEMENEIASSTLTLDTFDGDQKLRRAALAKEVELKHKAAAQRREEILEKKQEALKQREEKRNLRVNAIREAKQKVDPASIITKRKRPEKEEPSEVNKNWIRSKTAINVKRTTKINLVAKKPTTVFSGYRDTKRLRIVGKDNFDENVHKEKFDLPEKLRQQAERLRQEAFQKEKEALRQEALQLKTFKESTALQEIRKETLRHIPFSKGKSNPQQPESDKKYTDISEKTSFQNVSQQESSKGHTKSSAGESLETSSDFSDEENVLPKKLSKPVWCQSPVISAALVKQAQIDPDTVFGRMPPLPMEEIFITRGRKFRQRTSSGVWEGPDDLTEEEQYEYKLQMGYL